MSLREITALILLAAIWGGSFLFIRIAVGTFGPTALMAGRVLIAAAVLGVLMAALRRPLNLRRHGLRLLVLGLVNAAIPFTLIATAELHLTASLAATLNATVPLFTAMLSVFWLGESLTVKRVTGLLLGIAGVAVLVGWSPMALTPTFLWSAAAMLAATLCYAFGAVFTKKYLAGAPAPALAFGQQLAAGAWLIVPALWLRPVAPPPLPAVWALIVLGVVCTAGAFLLYFYLIAHVGPTRTYTVTYLVPLFGMLWGAWFLDETISGGMFAGLGLILASLVLVNGVPMLGVAHRLLNKMRLTFAAAISRRANARPVKNSAVCSCQVPLRRFPTESRLHRRCKMFHFDDLLYPIEERAGLVIGLERLFARKRPVCPTKRGRHAGSRCVSGVNPAVPPRSLNGVGGPCRKT